LDFSKCAFFFIYLLTMTQSINDTYLFVQELINKQQNGYLPPDEFNRLINQAQYARFNELYGKPEQYAAVNMPVAKMAYARTQEISEKLSPFVTEVSLPVTVGVATVPVNLVHAVSMRYGTRVVKRVEYDRLSSFLNSVIDTPNADFPIYVQLDGQYKIYPTTVTPVTLDYLRVPNEAVWGYTVVSGRPVYNSGTSTDLEWDETEITNICMKLLSMFGISVKDQQMVNYAEQQKAQGN
jgi:hypothetical protein